jgi:GNAT superfamily N-acetyltransferase
MASNDESVPRIRIAGAGDQAVVVTLLRRQLDDHGIALDAAALERAVLGLLERPELGRILLATQVGADVGVAVLSFLWTLEHGGPAAWLDELYVDPAQRRHGIGAALVQAAARLARERGCIALDLEVEDGHDGAARLYARLGFHRHRRVRWALRLT